MEVTFTNILSLRNNKVIDEIINNNTFENIINERNVLIELNQFYGNKFLEHETINGEIIIEPEQCLDILNLVQCEDVVYKFKPGRYFLRNTLQICVNNISLIGLENVDFIQNVENAEQSGIIIHANNTILNNITIYTQNFIKKNNEYKQNKQTTLVVIGNNNKVINCNLFGGDRNYVVHFAGPMRNTPVSNCYKQNILNSQNMFCNNNVYGKNKGHYVSICLQNNMICKNNIINGGRLHIYASKNSCIENNNIIKSNSDGILCSLPIQTINIINNTILNSDYYAILVNTDEYVNVDSSVIIKHNLIINCKKDIKINDDLNTFIQYNSIVRKD